MPLVADLVEMTYDMLVGSSRPTMNKLAAAIGPTDTSVPFMYPVTMNLGDTFEIEDELFLTWNTDSQVMKSTDTERGFSGTDVNSHAQGSLVRIRPRFPRSLINVNLRQEASTLPTSIYRVMTDTVTTVANSLLLDLPAQWSDAIGIIEVSMDSINGAAAPIASFERGGMHTTGVGLSLSTFYDPRTIYVTGAFPFDTSNWSLTKDLDDVGITDTQMDMVAYGAAIRMLAPAEEVARSGRDAQGESRLASDVPPFYAFDTARRLQVMRDLRRKEEVQRLQSRYPVKMV